MPVKTDFTSDRCSLTESGTIISFYWSTISSSDTALSIVEMQWHPDKMRFCFTVNRDAIIRCDTYINARCCARKGGEWGSATSLTSFVSLFYSTTDRPTPTMHSRHIQRLAYFLSSRLLRYLPLIRLKLFL